MQVRWVVPSLLTLTTPHWPLAHPKHKLKGVVFIFFNNHYTTDPPSLKMQVGGLSTLQYIAMPPPANEVTLLMSLGVGIFLFNISFYILLTIFLKNLFATMMTPWQLNRESEGEKGEDTRTKGGPSAFNSLLLLFSILLMIIFILLPSISHLPHYTYFWPPSYGFISIFFKLMYHLLQ